MTLFFNLFRHNQEGEHIPIFQDLRDLHVMAVDAQRRAHFFYFFLESNLHQCICQILLTSRCVQWKPIT